MSARLLGAKQRKERFQLAENLRSARCSPFVISKALAARMRKLINARARKNKCTARMLAKTIRYHYDLWSRNWLLWLIEIIDCWVRIMVAMVRKPIEYQDWRLLGSKNRSVSEIDHPEHLPPGGGGGYSIYPWVGGAAWPLISWPWQKKSLIFLLCSRQNSDLWYPVYSKPSQVSCRKTFKNLCTCIVFNENPADYISVKML